eukprot:760642-Hanusia_phi.AAC.3
MDKCTDADRYYTLQTLRHQTSVHNLSFAKYPLYLYIPSSVTILIQIPYQYLPHHLMISLSIPSTSPPPLVFLHDRLVVKSAAYTLPFQVQGV